MPEPVLAFLAFTSGSYEGAIIRDMRLANALHRRGYKVVVYWCMETNRELVDPGIPQRVFVRGVRFQFDKPSRLVETAGRALDLYPAPRRRRFLQQHQDYVTRLLCNLVRVICDGGASDPKLLDRLESFVEQDGVTHLLPTFAFCCPLAQAVKRRGKAKFDYLVTFQGEEIFADYVQEIGRLDDYYARLRETVDGSGWPSVAVSRDYIGRIHEEMGVDPAKLVPIYPGIELPPADSPKPPFEVLLSKLPDLRPDVPIVTYFGRQDAEKGVDLLLYAVKMLQHRGVALQLVACGGSAFGLKYREVCEQIAGHLRVRVFWKRRISDEVRAALYAHSRCIVYPSIHREPFGMVAAESLSHGTPALVPDQGGVTEAIQWHGVAGGLTFKSWDSGDLADQLHRLLADDALHAELSRNARGVAAHFAVDKLADRVLEHMGLPTRR